MLNRWMACSTPTSRGESVEAGMEAHDVARRKFAHAPGILGLRNRGVFALLVGSGLSRAAEIPTGWEITLDLIRRVARAEGAENEADWAAWYTAKTGLEPNYSTLLEQLATSPAERRAILDSYLEPTPQDREENRKLPTPAHYAIADLDHGCPSGAVHGIRRRQSACWLSGRSTACAQPCLTLVSEPRTASCSICSALHSVELHAGFADRRLWRPRAAVVTRACRDQRATERTSSSVPTRGLGNMSDKFARFARGEAPSARAPRSALLLSRPARAVRQDCRP